MKNLLIITLLFTSFNFFGQVGVGTTQPEATLHINGTLLVNTTDQSSVTTTKIAGLNAKGNVRDITVGTNLTLQNNILSAKSGFDHSFGSINLNANSTKEFHNVDLLIGTGGTNEGKTIIRIFVTKSGAAEKAEITGFKAGYDGQHIWVYAQSDEVKLIGMDSNSLNANRIQVNDKPGMKQWAMIELVYDATNAKWIVMQNHS